MNSVNKTMYIPLYGKAFVSQKGLFLRDPKAEEIWEREGFPLKGKASSKWLAYYMGIRSAVFDDWLGDQLVKHPDAIVLHIGCGLDSRVLRVKHEGHHWYDLDFPAVIQERANYYAENESYTMIGSDLCADDWLGKIPKTQSALVVMEGVSMYIEPAKLQAILAKIADHFTTAAFLIDFYSVFAAKMSKYKNPVNEVGVSTVYGIDDPKSVESEKLRFVGAREMTPRTYIDQLEGMEKRIFQKLYAGKTAGKLYRLYEYQSKLRSLL